MIIRLLFLFALIWLLVSSARAEDLTGVDYITCYDGDTCMVDVKQLPDVFGKHLPVRLRGIDAPEIKGRCDEERFMALAARDYLRQRLKSAKMLTFQDATRDKYFRLDVTILADGVNVNQEMIERGYARPYDGSTRQPWCAP